MTPDELEQILFDAKDVNKLAEQFANLTEPERKKLSAFVSKLRSQITQRKAGKDASKRVQAYLNNKSSNYWSHNIYKNVELAVFAFCPVSALKRRNFFIRWDHRPALEKIILDRKPDWLDDYIAYDLDEEFSKLDFETIRRWVKAGICKKPTADGYYRKFAWALQVYQHNKKESYIPPADRLLAEPDLLDDIWRLFEIECDAFNIDSWHRKSGPENYQTWIDAFVALEQQKAISRERLLEATLKGLQQDVKQNQLSGISKLHTMLVPTKEELRQYQSEYLLLLGHKVGHVVKFAIKMLKQIQKHKMLNIQSFLTEVPAVFLQETKGNAVEALKCIKPLIKLGEENSTQALLTVCEALKHQNMDVQGLAVEILSEHDLNDAVKSEISTNIDFVANAYKPALNQLLGNKPSTDVAGAIELDPEAIQHQLKQTPVNVLQKLGLAGIDLKSDTIQLAPINSGIGLRKVLDTAEPLIPISSVDELFDTVAHLVEVVDNPEDVELVMDGISRLCNIKIPDFNDRAAPLLQRVNSGGGFQSRSWR